MSYNCDTWKTKELVDLVIPVESLFKCEREDWHPTRTSHDNGTVTFKLGDGIRITGSIQNDLLAVSDIACAGDGSGVAWHLVFEPALADSRGKLVATRIWEGGDSIDKLTVIDGKMSSEPIEL